MEGNGNALPVLKNNTERAKFVDAYAAWSLWIETAQTGERYYRYEMLDEDHEELLDVLLDHTGPVIVSGYNSPLYNDRLREWHREEAISYSQIASRKTEVLWMNFEPEGQREKMFE